MIAVDIETSCNGAAEFRYYRKGFQIDSIAASWRDAEGQLKNWFSAVPRDIDRFIRRLAELQSPLVVHNLSFEMGVFMCLYPDLTFNWAGDTMRLAQLRDNGGSWDTNVLTADDVMDAFLGEGNADEFKGRRNGLSLEAVSSRFLPQERWNHKKKAHDWLEQNHGVKSKHGQHLHLLPPGLLREYNIADTDNTLLLYEAITEDLRLLDFDWSMDWVLYTTRCRLMQQAYIRGLKIDQEKLRRLLYKADAEIKEILAEFQRQAAEPLQKWSDYTQTKPKKKDRKLPHEFNIGSNAQLKELFVGVLGQTCGKATKTGMDKVDKKLLSADTAARVYPSFASKHLKLWGPLGEILLKRRKALLVLQQMLGVYMGSLEDGRLHAEVKAAGTRTNRVAGGRSD